MKKHSTIKAKLKSKQIKWYRSVSLGIWNGNYCFGIGYKMLAKYEKLIVEIQTN